ncbi:ribosome biogenesis protein ytm1 [Marasmius tenuissimus]|nr:ribosome biogenesis protein ytm1 [Marasmius tenuissimus]
MNRVLQEIRRLQRWKNLLTKSKYYMAIGLVTDAALSRVLADVLELPDIPEVESNRLSELCRILHALEGLFVEDPEQPSFVVGYVPSWLKFSYLSELLEASLADITYLFESGALVDFQVDELVRLVKALFSDTPLRTNTINRLLEGHPVPSED